MANEGRLEFGEHPVVAEFDGRPFSFIDLVAVAPQIMQEIVRGSAGCSCGCSASG